MDYASGIWGFKDYSCCNKLQQRACRYYLGVHQRTPLLAIEGDIGWDQCKVRHYLEMGRFWNRLIQTSDSRLTKLIFEWDFSLCKNNWCSEMKEILYSINMNEIFDRQEVINLDSLMNELRQQQHSNWFRDLSYKPKLRTYKI
jgi:hypothetical protein